MGLVKGLLKVSGPALPAFNTVTVIGPVTLPVGNCTKVPSEYQGENSRVDLETSILRTPRDCSMM